MVYNHMVSDPDDSPSKLSKTYYKVPEYESIIRCVKEGRSRFEELLGSSSHMSCVHSYEDVEVQAFILALPSLGNDEEMRMKAYLTYATHWVDDFFDQFQFESSIKRGIKKHRTDLNAVLALFGEDVLEVNRSLYTHSVHKAAVQNGVHRLLYGSLINHADSLEEQQQYLDEHTSLFFNDLDLPLRHEIRKKLNPLLIGLTNKTAQEFWFGCEKTYDPNVTALYTLLYTPALYFHDYEEESSEQELQFLETAPPSVKDLNTMIELFRDMIGHYHDDRKNLRFRQLQFVVESFQSVLPGDTRRAYENVLSSR